MARTPEEARALVDHTLAFNRHRSATDPAERARLLVILKERRARLRELGIKPGEPNPDGRRTPNPRCEARRRERIREKALARWDRVRHEKIAARLDRDVQAEVARLESSPARVRRLRRKGHLSDVERLALARFQDAALARASGL